MTPRRMGTPARAGALTTSAVLLTMSAAAEAQPFASPAGAVVGGGGTSVGSTYQVRGVVGHPLAGPSSSGGPYAVSGGVSTPSGTAVTADTPPTLSTLTDRSTPAGTPAVVTFTIGDDATAVDALVVAATSSNGSLVSSGGLAITGTGATRTLTLSPVTGQVGTATITISVTDNAGLSTIASFVLSVTAAPAQSFTYYLAEGATSSFFETQIALLNPGASAVTASLRFLQAGRDPIVVDVPLPARTRRTVRANDVQGLAAAEFSTTIVATGPVVVDRTMTWDGTGYGAHAETAATAPAAVWYLAEGATHSGFSLFYLLQNPGDTATTVRVRYLRASGAPIEKDYVLSPRSRQNIWVNEEAFDGLGKALAAADVSAVLTSLDGTPFIVERAMYLTARDRLFDAGHESMGVTAPATRWFLAEGATGVFFDEFVLIANPSASDARVRVTYLLTDGRTFQKDMVARASARTNIWVDYETFDGVPGLPLANAALSTTVESLDGVPLIVERAMWWPGDASTWHEAHNSSGATETGTLWALAEGEVGGARKVQTYVLVANTSSFAGTARVTLLFEDGTSLMRDYPLLPRSRTNATIAEEFGAAVEGRRFGVLVEALGEVDGAPLPQLVVERAMYHDAGGVALAAGTNAKATKLR